MKEAETWINVAWSRKKPFPMIKLESIKLIINFFVPLHNCSQGLTETGSVSAVVIF